MTDNAQRPTRRDISSALRARSRSLRRPHSGAPVRVPSRLRTKPETVAGASFFGMAELPRYTAQETRVSLCGLADRRFRCRSTALCLRACPQEFLELQNDVGQRYG